MWTSTRNNRGYATFWTGERLVTAHRFAYELLVGPIPEGLHIDHLCNNGATLGCVRPDHMEPVTAVENNRRAATRRREQLTDGLVSGSVG